MREASETGTRSHPEGSGIYPKLETCFMASNRLVLAYSSNILDFPMLRLKLVGDRSNMPETMSDLEHRLNYYCQL